MDRAEALERLGISRTGHLATVRPDGRPHVVVTTFAIDGDVIVTAVDHKPKRSTRLQRLANIEANPIASFLVDVYEEDWSRLWWVRVDGPAVIHDDGEHHATAVDALTAKYQQYATTPPTGPVIALTLAEVSFWSSRP